MLKETLEYKVRVLFHLRSNGTPSTRSENSWVLGDHEKYIFQMLATVINVICY